MTHTTPFQWIEIYEIKGYNNPIEMYIIQLEITSSGGYFHLLVNATGFDEYHVPNSDMYTTNDINY